MDPFGNRGQFAMETKDQIRQFKEAWLDRPGATWKIYEMKVNLQVDQYNCGPWNIWMATQWLSYHACDDYLDKDFPTYFTEISLAGHSPAANAGDALRRAYTNFIHEADLDAGLPRLPANALSQQRRRSNAIAFIEYGAVTP
ncbi:hypothetical protein WJX73_002543 [Symbiochloris irregularis]|uniref:Peptidase C39-like domain-containing protein n=1 Tax=Symbiochloris irregularis TaxID=706552 RepID=A0AAW1NLJ0_9CHLO